MKRMILMVFILICVGLSACARVTVNVPNVPQEQATAGSQKASSAAVTPVFPELDEWLARNRMTINAGRAEIMEYDQAFAQGAVIAYGEGYPMAGAEAGQKRLTALRAAEVVAQRNLAEYFARYATNGEIRFSSYTTRLEAFLQGAVIVVSEYNPERERAAVLLKLDLAGAKGFGK